MVTTMFSECKRKLGCTEDCATDYPPQIALNHHQTGRLYPFRPSPVKGNHSQTWYR